MANATQSTQFFSVGDSFGARAAFQKGKYINILDPSHDLEGLVSHSLPQPGGILRVVMQQEMAAAPAVGALAQPLSTSLRYADNVVEWSKPHDHRWYLGCSLPRVPEMILRTGGDNGHDINGWHDIEILNVTCRHVGMWLAGTNASFGGLGTCIWLGYDPQNPTATFRGIGARVIGAKADVVAKTAVMVTEGVSDVLVADYELHGINVE